MTHKPSAPSKRGGARPGAGQASDGAKGVQRVTVMLDAASIEAAKRAGLAAIGRPEISAGVRAALQLWLDEYQGMGGSSGSTS